MSLRERSGKRDLLYSQWHREERIRRFLDRRRATSLTYIDIDCCEYCQWCSKPLALIETQRSSSAPKSATVTFRVAQQAQIPAYSVSYVPTADGADIERFRCRRLWPLPRRTAEMAPAEYAEWLCSLRANHACPRVQGVA